MSDNNQISMFEALGVEEEWRKEWQDMPEFEREDNMPFQKISVNFKTREDVKAFAALIGQRLTFDTDTIWFPAKTKIETGVWIDES
jgi:hypothetical protein